MTFRGTAADVTDRMFGPRHGPYEREGEEFAPFNRRSMYSTREGVERTAEEGDPDLPRYGESPPQSPHHAKTDIARRDEGNDSDPSATSSVSRRCSAKNR